MTAYCSLHITDLFLPQSLWISSFLCQEHFSQILTLFHYLTDITFSVWPSFVTLSEILRSLLYSLVITLTIFVLLALITDTLNIHSLIHLFILSVCPSICLSTYFFYLPSLEGTDFVYFVYHSIGTAKKKKSLARLSLTQLDSINLY